MSEDKKKGKRKGDKIAVEEIPANVMEAVDKVMPGGTVKVAMKWAKGDKVVYKVIKAVEAGKYMIKVAGDGTLLAVLHHDVMKMMWK